MLATKNLQYELWFVLEVVPRADVRHVYLLEPTKLQFYRTYALHERYHFQIRTIHAVRAYIKSMASEGVPCIPSARAQNYIDNQSSFCAILEGARNHFLDDVTVINCHGDSLEVGEMIKSMRLNEMAELMLTGSDSQDPDNRGNFRRDIGFCPQSQNDTSVIPGMNVPRYTTRYDSVEGLEGDNSFTVSMMNAAVRLRGIVNYVSRAFSLGWNDFVDGSRASLFSRRVAQERGVANPEEFVTEGNSIGITGIDPRGNLRLLRRHVDDQNARVPSHHFYWGVSVYESVRHEGWSADQFIRISFGGYGKKCIDDVMRRLGVNTSIHRSFVQWSRDEGDLFSASAQSILSWDGGLFRFMRPRVDKSVYYSIFVHGLQQVGEATSYDRGLLIEAVFAMSLTPSPSGWYNGIMHSLRIRRGRNLIVTFIEFMVQSYRCVSHGEGRRRQVSHGRSMSRRDLFQSLVNMSSLIDMATDNQDSRRLLRRWAGNPSRGGLQGVGELIATEQIHVLTVLGVICTQRHAERVSISRGTMTYRRLEELGVTTDSHRLEIIRYVCGRMGIDPWVGENGFCEWLRGENRQDGRFFDTVVRGQGLYFMRDGGVVEVDDAGEETPYAAREWAFGRAPMAGGLSWWGDTFDPSELEGEMVLTRN